jgi:hypothetical protein
MMLVAVGNEKEKITTICGRACGGEDIFFFDDDLTLRFHFYFLYSHCFTPPPRFPALKLPLSPNPLSRTSSF